MFSQERLQQHKLGETENSKNDTENTQNEASDDAESSDIDLDEKPGIMSQNYNNIL